MMKFGLTTLFVIAAFSVNAQTASVRTGKTVGVKPSATAEQGNRVRTLRINDEVREREIIRTTANGEAQILFEDGTRIAVGPGSVMELEEYVFSGRRRAEKVSINALAGSFRFISGRSRKGSFNITTPAATLAIRGTAFDFSVSPVYGTEVVMFRGRVDLCSRDNPDACVQVRGNCRAAAVTPRGTPALIDSKDTRNEMLDSRFGYTRNQSRLTPGFQLNTNACGSDGTRRAQLDNEINNNSGINSGPGESQTASASSPSDPSDEPDRESRDGRDGRGGR